MALEVKIHDVQTSILRELLFHPSAGYAVLQKPTGLTSDHFNFHIGRLVDLGLVEKVARGEYRLTPRGKEYANKLDTDNNTIERQPKVAVILAVEKEENGKRYVLFQERLKNPYFGFWGLPSGKIRWGETIMETAARELDEEAGLEADFRIAGVYHEHVSNSDNGEFLEDKVFFVMHGTRPRGRLKEKFEGGRNTWLTRKESEGLEKKFDSVDIEFDFMDFDDHAEIFVERHTAYGSDHF
jgi:ADP-ribose pyrophosphatase YjhB (NUDIX family)